MLILEKPYVSKLLEETAIKNEFKVLRTSVTEELGLSEKLKYVDTETAVQEAKDNQNFLVYSNSENSINWVAQNVQFTNLPKYINVFKDKAAFRRLVTDIYPDFFFKEVTLDEIKTLDVNEIKMPFIIKPNVGFFSMGVYKVNNTEDWQNVVSSVDRDMEKVKGLYPKEVMDESKFIIEQNIEGDEYAIDAYYNEKGEAVIVNIFKHIFTSEADVSDRLYITSAEIVRKFLPKFQTLLGKIGELAELKNFPIHIEVRADKNDTIIPIEVNPMRFAGWCTTDLAYYAYGINVYEHYLKGQMPDWDKILSTREGKTYSFTIADIPASIDRKQIESIDYDRFLQMFAKPLEVRRIDYSKYPVFCFVFSETTTDEELDRILQVDFSDFINVKTGK